MTLNRFEWSWANVFRMCLVSWYNLLICIRHLLLHQQSLVWRNVRVLISEQCEFVSFTFCASMVLVFIFFIFCMDLQQMVHCECIQLSNVNDDRWLDSACKTLYSFDIWRSFSWIPGRDKWLSMVNVDLLTDEDTEQFNKPNVDSD